MKHHGTNKVKARICWRINGYEGKGLPLPWRTAQSGAESLNQKHGAGTHWIEVVGCIPSRPEPDPF